MRLHERGDFAHSLQEAAAECCAVRNKSEDRRTDLADREHRRRGDRGTEMLAGPACGLLGMLTYDVCTGGGERGVP